MKVLRGILPVGKVVQVPRCFGLSYSKRGLGIICTCSCSVAVSCHGAVSLVLEYRGVSLNILPSTFGVWLPSSGCMKQLRSTHTLNDLQLGNVHTSDYCSLYTTYPINQACVKKEGT